MRLLKARFVFAFMAAAATGAAWCQTTPAGGVDPPASTAAADSSPPPSAPAKLGAAELEKLVEPIALHPDPLIAIILPAAAYPLEIVQAARFIKDTNNISKVDEQDWDDNVKALAKFPQMIAQMDTNLAWTVKLGQAFVEQPKELMDTIQSLRAKAQKAGTLQSTEQQTVTVTNMVVVQTNVSQVVTVTNEIVQVAPANPQVVYVPSYPPTVYYPPPGYVYNPVAPLVTFGVGMAWGAALANNCNWGSGHVDVDVNRDVNRNVNRNTTRSERASTTRGGSSQRQWQPDQNRMNRSGSPASAQNREARGWGGGSTQTGQRSGGGASAQSAQRSGGGGATRSSPSSGGGGTRPSQPSSAGGGARSSQRPASSGQRPSTPAARSPSASAASGSRSSSAFSGVNSGSSARSSASRGAASRGGGGGGGGRGGGGRR
jgi:hypothetical protein